MPSPLRRDRGAFKGRGFEVRGADQFLQLSKALKKMGDGGAMRKELHKGVKKAARPLIPKAKQEAKSRLPQRGGLAAQIAKEPARTQVRTGSRNFGVRIVIGKKKGGAWAANRGVIRHPVFGNREVWVEQKVQPGWFDDPMKESAKDIREDIRAAMNDVVDKVARSVRGGPL